MNGFVLGIDGGGTKTAVTAADLEGRVIGCFTAGAININGESRENVRENLKHAFAAAGSRFGGLEACRSVCVGAAGISNKETVQFLEKAVLESGYQGVLRIAGDHQTALYGALEKPEGIILIAGTGSICYGRNRSGEEHRTGGFGHLIDDEGSGYAIGRDILASLVQAHDGRGEATLLTELVYKQLGITSIGDVIGFLYHKDRNKRDIAALAPNLALACDAGDRVAWRIVEKCGVELLKLAGPVLKRLGLESGEMAMAGSVLKNNSFIRSELLKRISVEYPQVVCRTPAQDAAYGAMLMALEDIRR